MTKARPGERGGSRLKFILALLLTAAIIYALIRIVPVYVKSYDFQDTVRTEARFAGVNNRQPVEIRQRLLQKAQELGLPLRPEQIIVVPVSRGGVRISAHYSVPVQLIGYTLTLNFQTAADTASSY